MKQVVNSKEAVVEEVGHPGGMAVRVRRKKTMGRMKREAAGQDLHHHLGAAG